MVPYVRRMKELKWILSRKGASNKVDVAHHLIQLIEQELAHGKRNDLVALMKLRFINLHLCMRIHISPWYLPTYLNASKILLCTFRAKVFDILI